MAELGIPAAQFNLGNMYSDGRRSYRTINKQSIGIRRQQNKETQKHNSTWEIRITTDLVSYRITKQAVYWYKKSAEQGTARVQYNLGVMYQNGQGVLQDYKQAIYWYKKSAEQGHADAQYNLGAWYYNGEGVIKDYAIAHMWFNISAYSGNPDASETRDTVSNL